MKYTRERATLAGGRLKWTIKKAIESRIKNVGQRLFNRNGNAEPAADQKRIDAAVKALREYVPKVYPGSVTLFRASKQPAGYNNDRDLGWEKLAAGGVAVYEIPGYHGSIVMEPRVRVLAEQLRNCLRHAHESSISFSHDATTQRRTS